MNNQRRVLAELLSIDAWHDPIRINKNTSKVHVELSFRQGRLGGESDDFPFTFNVALKRAVLTVTLEPPLELDRNSVARRIPTNQAEMTRITSAREAAKSNSEFGGRVSPTSIAATAKAGIGKETEISRAEELKFVQPTPKIIAIPRPGGAHEYYWELLPGFDEVLDGQPWDPVKEPRFSTKVLNEDSRIERVIKATVSCKLEDIVISDLLLKNPTPINIIKEMAFNRVNEAAAIQQLKLTLKDMNLEAGAVDNRFSELMIADVLSVES